MKIQHCTNKRKLTESWSYGCLGSSLQKIESRVLIDKGALMIVHVLSGWLASFYPIRRAFLQHISWRVSVQSVINKRKRSSHFAWRNGSIAAWMFVHPTEYGGDIGLKGFLISQKLFSINIRISPLLSRGKAETCPNIWNRHIILPLKFIGSFKLPLFLFSTEFDFSA